MLGIRLHSRSNIKDIHALTSLFRITLQSISPMHCSLAMQNKQKARVRSLFIKKFIKHAMDLAHWTSFDMKPTDQCFMKIGKYPVGGIVDSLNLYALVDMMFI